MASDDVAMDNLKAAAAYYAAQLAGSSSGDAYHALLEADDRIVPYLIQLYYSEQNLEVRTLLIEVIWQHRSVDTAGFLENLLTDRTPAIWKNALDGLVAIGGEATVAAIHRAQRRVQDDPHRLGWFDEALEQIQHGFLPDP